MYMVDILIRKYLNKGVEYDDLYQVVSLALISAVERFDPDRGFDFSSFATPTIIGDIKKHFPVWGRAGRSRANRYLLLSGPSGADGLSSCGRAIPAKSSAKYFHTAQEHPF